METILEMDAFQVSTANGGQSALRRIEEAERSGRCIDFLVLDLDMAHLSGIDLLTEMRLRGLCQPVMVVTGHASRATVVELLRHGVADFLDKPLNLEEFRSRIRSLASLVERCRRGKAHSHPPSQPTFSETTLDLAHLKLPHAARQLMRLDPDSHLVLAARKSSGYDLLLADTRGLGGEGFFTSVLIRTFFDRNRSGEIDGRDFMRRLNQALIEGCLSRSAVNALYVRIRTDKRQVEVFPAGYPARWYLGAGDSDARVARFKGSPLGLLPESSGTLCEFPYIRNDKLLLCSGPGTDEDIPGPLMGTEPAQLEALVDGMWNEFLSACRERSKNDFFLLGVELP